jgi:O-Antigen ligase
VSDALLALWVMLIGADRIDLLGGKGVFVLTPYLALTPIVLASELVRGWREHRAPRFSRLGLVYVALVAALLTVVVTSAIDARDVQISSARALLLATEVAGTFAVVIACRERRNAGIVLARGASASLIVFVLFDVAEAMWWFGRGAETMRLGSVLIHFGALQNVGVIPRLAGPVSDANRGGFVLLFFASLISLGEPRPVLRRIGLSLIVLLLVATISRSALLGAAAMGLVMAVRQRGRVSLVPLVAASLIATAGIGLFLANPGVVRRAAAVLTTPAEQRFSTTEGSAQSHLALIERGLGNATESVPTALIGLGYGNSHLVLQDVFPGNKYGNFHSLYVSMFAESGVVALLLITVLMFTPLIAGGPWRPLIAGAVVFNLFYQTPTEPAFWFALAAAWVTIPSASLKRRSMPFASQR